jgi:hypothetical protein
MEDANIHSASQEIPRLLRNQKAHYSVQKSPSLVPILSQMHPIHTFPTYFPTIYFNIIFQFTPSSSEWSLPFMFSNQNIL